MILKPIQENGISQYARTFIPLNKFVRLTIVTARKVEFLDPANSCLKSSRKCERPHHSTNRFHLLRVWSALYDPGMIGDGTVTFIRSEHNKTLARMRNPSQTAESTRTRPTRDTWQKHNMISFTGKSTKGTGGFKVRGEYCFDMRPLSGMRNVLITWNTRRKDSNKKKETHTLRRSLVFVP